MTWHTWERAGKRAAISCHIHDAKEANVKRCCHAIPEKTEPVACIAQGSTEQHNCAYEVTYGSMNVTCDT